MLVHQQMRCTAVLRQYYVNTDEASVGLELLALDHLLAFLLLLPDLVPKIKCICSLSFSPGIYAHEQNSKGGVEVLDILYEVKMA